jgi:predicted flap endonuclease-1-like 5' DNA nuclease
MHILMTMNRSTKSLIAVIALVAALFLAVNHIVDAAPIQDWLLAGVLFAISVGFWVWLWQEHQASTALAVRDDEAKAGTSQEWIITRDAAGQVEEPVATGEPAAATSLETDDEEEEPDLEITSEPDTTGDVAEEVSEQIAEEPEETAEVVERARRGGAVAEQKIADAMAGGPTGLTEEAMEEAEETIEEEITGEPVEREDQASDETTEAPEPDHPPEGEALVTPEEVDQGDAPITDERADDDEGIAVVDRPPKGVKEVSEDLTVIDGIGPKYRDALVEAGYATFADLAQASEDDLEIAIRGIGLRRPGSLVTWAEQAGYAARGDWDGLEEFKVRIKGG